MRFVTGPGGLFATRLLAESGHFSTKRSRDKPIEDCSTLHRGPRQRFSKVPATSLRHRFATGGRTATNGVSGNSHTMFKRRAVASFLEAALKCCYGNLGVCTKMKTRKHAGLYKLIGDRSIEMAPANNKGSDKAFGLRAYCNSFVLDRTTHAQEFGILNWGLTGATS